MVRRHPRGRGLNRNNVKQLPSATGRGLPRRLGATQVSARPTERSRRAPWSPSASARPFSAQSPDLLEQQAGQDSWTSGFCGRSSMRSTAPQPMAARTAEQPIRLRRFPDHEGDLRVARPVAIAQTTGASDDQTAPARLRQNGTDSVSLMFYRSMIRARGRRPAAGPCDGGRPPVDCRALLPKLCTGLAAERRCRRTSSPCRSPTMRTAIPIGASRRPTNWSPAGMLRTYGTTGCIVGVGRTPMAVVIAATTAWSSESILAGHP